jgi:hypothetical protein
MQPHCKACGQLILGRYLTAFDAFWHPEHFVCAGCARPIHTTSFHTYQDAPYHIECYARLIAPRCAYCSQPLIVEYLVDYWGMRFCKEHRDAYPACAYCGRLVPPQQCEQPEGEAVCCSVCRSTAIETVEDARPLFTSVKQWVGSQGLVYNNLPLSLDLCGRARLAELLRERSLTHARGATVSSTYSQNGHVVYNEIKGVAVLRGLPATLFQGVTVHELGHVWLIVHNIQEQLSWAEEGFCELLSYRFYQALKTPESLYYAQCLEQNLDPIYGEGFRRIRASAERLGWPRFLESTRASKRLLV